MCIRETAEAVVADGDYLDYGDDDVGGGELKSVDVVVVVVRSLTVLVVLVGGVLLPFTVRRQGRTGVNTAVLVAGVMLIWQVRIKPLLHTK